MEEKYFLMRQENIYWNSNSKDHKWYRELFGGTWMYLKLGKDTPNTSLFCVWTKIPLDRWSGYKKIIKKENYPITGVDTKYKLFKQLIKQICKKK